MARRRGFGGSTRKHTASTWPLPSLARGGPPAARLSLSGTSQDRPHRHERLQRRVAFRRGRRHAAQSLAVAEASGWITRGRPVVGSSSPRYGRGVSVDPLLAWTKAVAT